jgi:hypothetical protein
MGLFEEVHELILRRDRMKLKRALKKMMTDKVTINLNIFGSFMKNIIMGNLNITSVVTVDKSS